MLEHPRAADHCIPEGSKILGLNFTPNSGNLFPALLLGNSPMDFVIKNQVTLFPVPMEDGHVPSETLLAVWVAWIPSSQDDEAWESLVRLRRT